jgi:serine/threonine-protein kinase
LRPARFVHRSLPAPPPDATGEDVPRAFRRNDWIIGLIVVALVAAATAGGWLRGLEGRVYEAATGLADDRPASESVVIVRVDDTSLERLGSWPWSRYALAEINALIARGDPRTIGYALPLETPQNEHAQRTLTELLEANRERLDPDARALLRRAIRDMGTDRVLAASFQRSGRVVLGARARVAEKRPASLPGLPAALGRGALRVVDGNGLRPANLLRPGTRRHVERVQPPVGRIAAAADGVGLIPDRANGVPPRTLPLALPYRDAWLPTFPLLVYAHARGLAPGELQVIPGEGVRAGDRLLAGGPGLEMHPVYGLDGRDGAGFRSVSAAAVHAREVDPGLFTDRIVLVGITAPSLVAAVDTPAGPRMPVEALAAEISSLLEGHLYRVPDWAAWSRGGAFALVALYLMFVLPRLGAGTALAVSGLLLVVLVNAELVTLLVREAWIPLVAPSLALVLGHAILGGKRAVRGRLVAFQAELTAANRELAAVQREAGRLDEAWRRLQRCTSDDETLEQVYAVGLDFERRRRFPQAAEAFRFCDRHAPGFRDAAGRAERNERLQDSVALGGRKQAGSTQTLALDDGALERPMLGRYELDRELGKGAMGTVYLGRDPRIGREVAIKTMPLDQEFEGQSLREVKARFLREAETAGRLSHPHIVTIHDVGEEQDLAWIAMDYLAGTPMIRFADPEHLLPPAEVFEVLAQVAEALAAAHQQNVVHRDIKPDNIIYDRERGTATVTDFGIACLLDHRHTRTGTILGSPSYMSPEQLAAREMDGRSDLFSMGVTLYQLLTGELPFVGDSLSNLMYRIANERHRDVRRVRGDLPTCAATITNRCMEKDPARRYASASQLAQALRRCRGKL